VIDFKYTRADNCVTKGTYNNDGLVDGVVTVYFPSGAVKELKQFKKNIPSGTHTTYSEDGSVLNVVEYSENGEVLSVNGNPLPIPDEGL
tara:strand:- start:269 stop:535 length:267 start_codon:yes stop_codon:yes gene_type:complete